MLNVFPSFSLVFSGPHHLLLCTLTSFVAPSIRTSAGISLPQPTILTSALPVSPPKPAPPRTHHMLPWLYPNAILQASLANDIRPCANHLPAPQASLRGCSEEEESAGMGFMDRYLGCLDQKKMADQLFSFSHPYQAT